MKWFVKCMRHYADFRGRARRMEYWTFMLVCCLILYAIMIPGLISSDLWSTDKLLSAASGNPFALWKQMFSQMWYYYAVGLIFFLPGLAVTVRRLHDTGRSGTLLAFYWVLYAALFLIYIVLIHFIGRLGVWADAPESLDGSALAGTILCVGYLYGMLFRGCAFFVAFLVWLCLPGDRGPNKYGPDPKAVGE